MGCPQVQIIAEGKLAFVAEAYGFQGVRRGEHEARGATGPADLAAEEDRKVRSDELLVRLKH